MTDRSIDDQVEAYRHHLEQKMAVLVNRFVAEYRDMLERMHVQAMALKPAPAKSARELIADVLRIVPAPITARQIADVTDLNIATVRGTLYLEQNADLFQKHGSGSRVRWSLRAPDAEHPREGDA